MRPKLDASKDLKKIVSRLTLTSEKSFTQKLDEWYEIYKGFLDEKSVSSTTGDLPYTHPRIRAAYLHYVNSVSLHEVSKQTYRIFLLTKVIKIHLFQIQQMLLKEECFLT